jgi:hypothetical protein
VVPAGPITTSQTSSFRAPHAATRDPFSYWTVSPAENLATAVPLRKADTNAIENETVPWIVHNLSGYELSILIQFAKTATAFSVARNAIIGHITHPATDQIDWSWLPRSFVTGGYFRVVCPKPPPRLAASNRSAGCGSEA